MEYNASGLGSRLFGVLTSFGWFHLFRSRQNGESQHLGGLNQRNLNFAQLWLSFNIPATAMESPAFLTLLGPSLSQPEGRPLVLSRTRSKLGGDAGDRAFRNQSKK